MIEPVAWDNPKRRLCAWIKESKAEISRIDAVPDLARTRDRCRSLYLRHNQHNYSRSNSTGDRGRHHVNL